MKNNSGQAVLIIVLIMAIALTIGMAIVSRSITDVKLSSQDEESARAFSAAEAGLDDILQQNLTVGSGNLFDNKITYSVTSEVLGNSPKILFPKQIVSGDSQFLWLVGHDNDGNIVADTAYSGGTITLYWGNSGSLADDSAPAIEASLYYKVGAEFKVAHWAFDPYSSRNPANSFNNNVSANNDVLINIQGSITPAFRTDITLPTGTPYLLSIKLLYNTDVHWLGVGSSGANINFPAQATCYKSTAKIVESGVSRAVYQCRYYKTPTSLFDYALYSRESLEK